MVFAVSSHMCPAINKSDNTAIVGKVPNFIIIIADDMGYSDVQCYGNQYINTPNINYLARNGMKFTDAHANSALSTPTRAAFMTGRYQQRVGLEGVILENIAEHEHAGLPVDQVTFAEVLSKSGYETCLLGKWHLGKDKEYHPQNFGFKQFCGFLSGNVDYFTRVNNKCILDWWNGFEKERIEGYTTSILTTKAVDYINENSKKPFCLVISESCPHGPLQGPEDYPLRFEGQKPKSLIIKGQSQHNIYKNMIEELDSGVGEIINALKINGIENNTLVIFMSDNGPNLRNDTGSAHPFKEGKGSMFEGGHRVPFVAYMPGTIEPGTVCETPVMGFDIFPTMVDMADIDCKVSKPLDGISILPLLQGKTVKTRTLYWALGHKKAIRDGKWKYIVSNTKEKGCTIAEEYLFNMDNDCFENINLIDKHKSVVAQLKNKLNMWYDEVTSEHEEQLVPYISSLSN